MPAAGSIRLPSRRDPVVAAIARRWRALTGSGRDSTADRRTLVACSGGADSSALALALASAAPRSLVLAHIVHDMRPEADALADRDAVRELAAATGVPFAEAAIATRPAGGNAEATARRLRYAALVRLAREHGCQFLATAHHAGDQIESVLMALLRGSGLRGLSGIAPRRRLGGAAGTVVIRPMLETPRGACERLCRQAGWAWREDLTNRDVGRLRGALRHRVVPVLEGLRPGAATRAAASAALLRDADRLIATRAAALVGVATVTSAGIRWDRDVLRAERPVVVGAAIRLGAARLSGGRGRDRLGVRVIAPAVRAIRSAATDPKLFGFSGVVVRMDAHRVDLEAERG